MVLPEASLRRRYALPNPIPTQLVHFTDFVADLAPTIFQYSVFTHSAQFVSGAVELFSGLGLRNWSISQGLDVVAEFRKSQRTSDTSEAECARKLHRTNVASEGQD
jgi:hypothetical protein